MANEQVLQDKVIVITGAGRGIGREFALLAAAHGAKVVVNDLGTEVTGEGRDEKIAEQVVREIRGAGGEAEAQEGLARHLGVEQVDADQRIDVDRLAGLLEGLTARRGDQRLAGIEMAGGLVQHAATVDILLDALIAAVARDHGVDSIERHRRGGGLCGRQAEAVG